MRLDDILPEMSGDKYFSVIDTKNGSWHAKLDKESQLYTTFNTPWANKKLSFGITCGEAFQQSLVQVISDLDNTQCISDDMFIWGRTETEEAKLLYNM